MAALTSDPGHIVHTDPEAPGGAGKGIDLLAGRLPSRAPRPWLGHIPAHPVHSCDFREAQPVSPCGGQAETLGGANAQRPDLFQEKDRWGPWV